MPSFLLFSLWAPLASMGDHAIGEHRTGFDRPAKSAVIGMVAAALGIDRGEDGVHQRLAAGYGFAVRTEAEGTLIRDFHTSQVAPARKTRWATRREEVADPAREVVLSYRDYRCDARHTVALWAREGAPVPLEDVGRAIGQPRFALYAGRKGCPLGLPPGPKVLDGADLPAVFRAFEAGLPAVIRDLLPDDGDAKAIFSDTDAADAGWVVPLDHALRRDDLMSRRRWQFGLRQEVIAADPGRGTA